MNNRCLECNEEILQQVRKDQRFCNIGLGRGCHIKFRNKLKEIKNNENNKEYHRKKFAMYNRQIMLESNRKAQKIFKDIRRIIKQDFMPIIINGKAL